MKCIYCNTDTTYPVRRGNGGRCRSCRHPFAFEPKTDTVGDADGLFLRAVKDVSGDNAVFFTEGQLWYEFNRRLLRKKVPHVTGGAVLITLSSVGGSIVALAAHTFWPLAIITVPGVIGGIVLRARAKRAGPPPQHPRISEGEFRHKYLTRWGAVHGRIEKLMPPLVPQPAPAAPPPGCRRFQLRPRPGHRPCGDRRHAGRQQLPLREQLRHSQRGRLPGAHQRHSHDHAAA